MGPLAGAWEALCLLTASDGTVYAGTTPHGDVYRWNPLAAGDAPLLPPSLALRVVAQVGSSRIVRFDLPEPGSVRLDVYNAAGRLVGTVLDDRREAGSHTARWRLADGTGRPLASGAYFLSLKTEYGSASTRTVVIR
jgi:hypothetical protein